MLFISEISRLLWFDNPLVMKLLQLFLSCGFAIYPKNSKYLLDTVLIQGGFIHNNIVWWSRFNGNIMEVMGTDNQVSHIPWSVQCIFHY